MTSRIDERLADQVALPAQPDHLSNHAPHAYHLSAASHCRRTRAYPGHKSYSSAAQLERASGLEKSVMKNNSHAPEQSVSDLHRQPDRPSPDALYALCAG